MQQGLANNHGMQSRSSIVVVVVIAIVVVVIFAVVVSVIDAVVVYGYYCYH